MQKIRNVGNKYIIIRGAIATGKTTLATALRDYLNATNIKSNLIELDEMRNFYGDIRPTYKNKKFAVKIGIVLSNFFLKQDFLPIVEGVLYEDDLLNRLIHDIQGSNYLIRLVCNQRLALERDMSRKHPRGDEKVTASPTWFSGLRDEETLLDTDNNLETLVEKIINLII